MGFKVFKERIENPVPGALYSTYDNPIQAFTWEDFSAYPGVDYTYYFTPLYGSPLNIKRGEACSINVQTEPDWKEGDHSVFFNRGVASSQAYAMKFGNKNPDEIPDGKAYKWLSRGLNEAIVSFINKSEKGDHLYGCFYEFRNDAILNTFMEAATRGVKIDIIYDAKDNGHLDSKTGNWVDSFPKVENEQAINRAKLNQIANIKLIPREKNKSYLCHNKFMVIVEKDVTPKMVWTGSTNISKGGIFGQTNVGHAVEDIKIATNYLDYWKSLEKDPDSKTIKGVNEGIHADITSVNKLPNGLTCILSPRNKLGILQFYADLLDSAKDCACITLAFGVHDFFEKALSDNTVKSALTFILLEKDDPGISDYVYKNNVIKAVGSSIHDNSVFKWVKETNTAALGLNTHVMYVHTKFLLMDPLSEVPVVVTGSANFSEAATDINDENMIIIKGVRRVADIYFTEFMRIFNHYYFRWILNKMLE
jgi:phosphatidylserine/phosphatidylglycerophosphate/cardiolipin synthase-like enzyme